MDLKFLLADRYLLDIQEFFVITTTGIPVLIASRFLLGICLLRIGLYRVFGALGALEELHRWRQGAEVLAARAQNQLGLLLLTQAIDRSRIEHNRLLLGAAATLVAHIALLPSVRPWIASIAALFLIQVLRSSLHIDTLRLNELRIARRILQDISSAPPPKHVPGQLLHTLPTCVDVKLNSMLLAELALLLQVPVVPRLQAIFTTQVRGTIECL